MVPPTNESLSELVSDARNPSYRTYSKPGLRATTAAGYENSIYKHIIPSIGHLLLNNITADDLQKFYADLKSGGRLIRGEIYGKGLSDRSVRACGIC
ncbi:MAG: hypothetical protein II779_11845, partial [Clostridia bacterium]|nr:hypothetical protein [Clostridia bacterium]